MPIEFLSGCLQLCIRLFEGYISGYSIKLLRAVASGYSIRLSYQVVPLSGCASGYLRRLFTVLQQGILAEIIWVPMQSGELLLVILCKESSLICFNSWSRIPLDNLSTKKPNVNVLLLFVDGSGVPRRWGISHLGTRFILRGEIFCHLVTGYEAMMYHN